MNFVPALRTWKQAQPYSGLLIVWVLTMISLPIVRYYGNTAVFNSGVVLSVLVQALLVLRIVQNAWGWRHTARAVIIVGMLAWGAEAVGSATGFPFGAYHYTKALQPQLLHVPLVIPLAWFMMLPPAWAIAQHLAGSRSRLAFVAVSAAAFTAWDLFLDPQMVSWNFWVWANPGGYFGIPWVNFGGWLLVAAVITAVIKPKPLPLRPLLLIYTITWALESTGLLLFWNLPGPALAGFAGMGFFVWQGWSRLANGQLAARLE